MDSRTGAEDQKTNALSKYETDATMTAAIVWVMKNDSDATVQMKAWRVLRARWRRGTGNPSDHEEAAMWLATNGNADQRAEAMMAVGNNSETLVNAERCLADSAAPVRQASVVAVYEVGKRTGERSEALRILRERQAVEKDAGVGAKIADLIAEL